MFHVKSAQPNGVLNRYQPNSSQLHNGSGTHRPTPTHPDKPPLPLSKPPLSRIPSQIPTKMQNLEPSVVTKFLQAVNGSAPQENTPVSITSRIEPKKMQSTSPSNNRLRENESPATHPWMSRNQQNPKSPESISASRSVPAKTVPDGPSWVTKQADVPKPSYRAVANPSAVWTAKANASQSNGALSVKQNSVNVKGASSGQRVSYETDWHGKYEEAEKRKKEALIETQRVEREKAGLERRLMKLEEDYKHLKIEHDVKSQQLSKLSQVSEKVYQDYDQLNMKYEVETSALHRALGAASKWYTENKKLKRESIARTANQPSPLDETDGDDKDLEELKNTVQELSQRVGELQAELNRAKLLEFETQEQLVNLNQQLIDERSTRLQQEKELKDLRLMREKFESVTVMVQGEVESLRQQRDSAIEELSRLQTEAHQAKTERNVLAHQSSLLMGDITPDDRLFNVLLEVEDLKRQVEDERHKHEMEMRSLQERIEDAQSDSRLELLEEKLNLAESELQLALERAEAAEQNLAALTSKVNAEAESKPPIPPPPPPPPPMPMISLSGTPQQIRKVVRRPTEGDSLEDMARLLGIQRTPRPVSQPGPIDNIINEIKGGKFTLKATEKQKVKKEESPAAVQEMLDIIGTLKRRPRRPVPV